MLLYYLVIVARPVNGLNKLTDAGYARYVEVGLVVYADAPRSRGGGNKFILLFELKTKHSVVHKRETIMLVSTLGGVLQTLIVLTVKTCNKHLTVWRAHGTKHPSTSSSPELLSPSSVGSAAILGPGIIYVRFRYPRTNLRRVRPGLSLKYQSQGRF